MYARLIHTKAEIMHKQCFFGFLKSPSILNLTKKNYQNAKKIVFHILTASRKMRKAKVIEIVLFKRFHDSLPIEMQNMYGSVPYELFRCYF